MAVGDPDRHAAAYRRSLTALQRAYAQRGAVRRWSRYRQAGNHIRASQAESGIGLPESTGYR
jgi:hypothetical protein